MKAALYSLGAAAILGAFCAGEPVGATAQQQESTRNASDVITIVGCVQRETEYRSQINDGKGGIAGTGVGAANEFVLRAVRSVSPETLKPTGTTGATPAEVYSVTGNLEREMEKAVGRQVAVSGYVEVATTGGTEKVKDLPRFNAIGWHTVSQKCAATSNRR